MVKGLIAYLLTSAIVIIALTVINQSHLYLVYANQEDKLGGLGIEGDQHERMEEVCALTEHKPNSAGQTLRVLTLDSANITLPGTIAGQGNSAEAIQHCEEIEKTIRDDVNKTSALDTQTIDKFKQEWAQSFCLPDCE